MGAATFMTVAAAIEATESTFFCAVERGLERWIEGACREDLQECFLDVAGINIEQNQKAA